MTKSEKTVAAPKRIIYFDYLRIVAIIAVVVLHTASQNWYIADISSPEWNAFTIFDSLVRWGVPVFVMISGALFLSKKQTIAKLYKKNIFRILILLVIWTSIYTIWQISTNQNITTLKDFLVSLATGPYHLWFLYMLVGLYMVVPLLERIVQNNKTTKYFLILALIFAFLIPELTQIIALKSELVSGLIENKLDMMRLFMVLGFTGYFVLGYYLNKTKIKRKTEIIIYILGCLGAIFTTVATLLLSNTNGSATPTFYNNLTINVAAMGIAVFVFFKNHICSELSSERIRKWVQLISRCSLGVYLVHVLILNILDFVFNLNSLSFNSVIAVPVLALIVLAISYPVSIILYKIPFIGKWIV